MRKVFCDLCGLEISPPAIAKNHVDRQWKGHVIRISGVHDDLCMNCLILSAVNNQPVEDLWKDRPQ